MRIGLEPGNSRARLLRANWPDGASKGARHLRVRAILIVRPFWAGVVKLADARDSKSRGGHPP